MEFDSEYIWIVRSESLTVVPIEGSEYKYRSLSFHKIWLEDKNIKYKYNGCIKGCHMNEFAFQNKNDAMHFRLVWG